MTGRFCYKDNGRWNNWESSTCHSPVRQLLSGLTGLVSTLCKVNPLTNKWWDFLAISNPVYRELFEVPGWKVMADASGQYHMFSMPAEVFKLPVPRMLLYAFLIDSRVPFDPAGGGTERVKTWDLLVSLGVEPTLAHLMSVHFNVMEDKLYLTGMQWNGAHQVLNDNWHYGTMRTDFSMYLRGEYRTDGEPDEKLLTSQLWFSKSGKSDKHVILGSNDLKDLTKEKSVGSWSKSYYIDLDSVPEVVEIYKKRIEERRKFIQ